MSELEPTMAWAVVVDDAIDVATISPTERAAKINYLCTRGVMVLAHAQNKQIEQTWEKHKGKARTHAVMVQSLELSVAVLDILAKDSALLDLVNDYVTEVKKAYPDAYPADVPPTEAQTNTVWLMAGMARGFASQIDKLAGE